MADEIDPGQFDDAPNDTHQNYREGQAYIDTYIPTNLSDEDNLDWPDTPNDSDEIDDTYDDSRIEDEDWEIAERDFTKQYNRLRQHVAVRTGNAQGTTSAINQKTSVAILPALNHPRSSITASPASTTAIPQKGKDRGVDQLSAFSSKYNSRISKIDAPYVMGVGVNRKGPSAHANVKDKSDRATNEQVLDPRTRLILFKMIGRELIHEINGCVSTGKEANVYHALTPQATHLALKIYKTSILIFKDRDKYVTGEYRFRRGYSRNPRKMVRLWAEKEMRNLKRLVAAKIRCPDPLEVRENVLVMTFVGDKEGWASPRLKDAELPSESVAFLYTEIVCIVRRMFHECKLVHADLSEYNILFHDGHLWIIDVSQSVEHDHPSAFDFLRKDIKNLADFFGKLGVRCLSLRRFFDFVTREDIGAKNGEKDESVLDRWLAEIDVTEDDTGVEVVDDGQSQFSKAQHSDAHEDQIFMRSFIPRTLNEVFDPERDIAKLNRGEGHGLIYADTIGLVGVQKNEGGLGQDEAKEERRDENEVEKNFEDDSADSNATDEDVEEAEEDGKGVNVNVNDFQRKPRGHRHEDREAKKERKKVVKAENKEKRKNKMPKAEKQRIIKKSRN